jgi:hypothetical protein
MKLISSQFRAGAWLCTCLASVVLVGAALAQPPRPGGSPGGGGGAPGGPGGPGAGPGGPSAPSPGPAGPGPGGGSPGGGAASPTFVLNFCNKSNDNPVIFIAVAGAAGQQFRAQGWAQVPQGQCVQIGTFARPAVWAYGRSPKGEFWGDQKTGVDLCVNLNGGFDYTWDGSPRQCGQDEFAAPFFKIDVPATAPAFNMTLN